MLDKGLLDKLNNFGDDLYQTWSYEQRREEIGKLVQGFKNGLPAQILCQLSTSIAGSPALAAEHLAAFLTKKERKAILRDSGSDKNLRAQLQAVLL